MVSMIASGVLRCDRAAAEFAGKAVVAGVCFVIAFFKGSSFILSVHDTSSDDLHKNASSRGTACVDLPTSRQMAHTEAYVLYFKKQLLSGYVNDFFQKRRFWL